MTEALTAPAGHADLPRVDAGALGNLRILHVLDHSLPIPSGYSFRTIALLREQRRRGWQTFQLTTPKHTNDGPSPETVGEFVFHRTKPLPAFVRDLPVLGEIALIRSVAREIERIARAERIQVLHAHSPVLNALACFIAARKLDLPVVYEVRGFWEDAAVSHGTSVEGGVRYRVSRAIDGWALKRADAVVTICDGLRQDMLMRGIPADHITVIANGVDIENFKFGLARDAALQASLDLTGRTVLGFLGSFYAYEGLDLLLSALPKALRARPDLAVLLVGGGPAEAALKAQARELGIKGAVRFVGHVPHSKVQSYYGLVDIFVYPRHRMRLTETVTPLKPLEAMAHGGIVLASDVGGHRELVRDGTTGFLFSADDAEAFTDAILRLIERRDGWEAIRRRGRDFVERERSWAVTTAGYPEAYARALHAR